MKKRIGLRLQLPLVLLLLVQAGCIKKTIAIPLDQRLLPAKTAARGELFQALEEKSKQIQTLKGTVSLDLSRGGAKSGVLDEYRQTKGYVFVDRPAHIRVQVQLPIVLSTVAIMVSDGIQYRISIPIKNQYAVRDIDEPLSSKSSVNDLRPQMFLDGLFVDVRPYAGKPNVRATFEEQVQGVHSYYVFSFIDISNFETELLEKIWIDRTDLQVSRKQVFGKDGRVETDVDYQNYLNEDGIPYPEIIVIHRPVEDYTVKMTFQQTTLNETLDSNIFNLPRPEGSELVQLAK